ncbi:uncharacterized protein LOC135136428 isoform X2 [Zophobas morio]|uniref:uncharacterized protein LOC135136428 isoform X2 n=1 Tax=Zophobas morio TaxID=2755281 RepID=UPI003082BE96
MLCRAILLLLLLFLATVAAVNHDRCTANQTRGLILSCETSCVKSQHVCTLGSACVCKNGLFRDQKTGLCVLPGECPPFLLFHVVLSFIADFIAVFLPSPVVSFIRFLMTANNVRRLMMSYKIML